MSATGRHTHIFECHEAKGCTAQIQAVPVIRSVYPVMRVRLHTRGTGPSLANVTRLESTSHAILNIAGNNAHFCWLKTLKTCSRQLQSALKNTNQT